MTPRLLVLDRYHLGDPLFPRALARVVRGGVGPLMIVHDSGDAGERALEATGALVERRDGALVTGTIEEKALVERAVREQNRQIAHELTEEQVSTVRVMGTDRGLLRLEGGALHVGRTDWLATLAAQGAVPVVGGLAASLEGPVEVDATRAALALGAALGTPPELLYLARDTRGGVRRAGAPVAELPAAELAEHDVPGSAGARAALAAGAAVWAVSFTGLRPGTTEGATRLTTL